MVHQNSAHHFRGKTEELGAVLPVYVFLVDEPEVSLVYQRGRLKSVIGKFLPEAIDCNPPQFLIDERQHLIKRGFVPVAPVYKELSDAIRGGIVHQSLLLLYEKLTP